MVKFETHSFKEKNLTPAKKACERNSNLPITNETESDILQQVQHIIKEETSDASRYEEEGIVKFALPMGP